MHVLPDLEFVEKKYKHKPTLLNEFLQPNLMISCSMEPSGVGGIGEQFEEGCSGSVPSLDMRPSYLTLMASVAPQSGLVQHSSFASWYNHDCSIDQLPHIPPSVDSAVEEQPSSPNYSRSDEEMPFASFGEDYSGDESDEHIGQEISCGYYSSAEEGTCQRMRENTLVAGVEEDCHDQYDGKKPDIVIDNQPIEHIQHDVAVGYSSAEDGPCKSVTRWGRTSPLANNEKIMDVVEQAMRNSRAHLPICKTF